MHRKVNRDRVVFARIGWMNYYRGSIPGDERPIGGGRHNDDNVGYEVNNFKPVAINGSMQCFGFASTITGEEKEGKAFLNLNNIAGENVGHKRQLDNVTVIFFSNPPDIDDSKGVIVGWYIGATVYKYRQPALKDQPWYQDRVRNYDLGHFTCQTGLENAFLLPVDQRIHSIVPKGRNMTGFPGMSNCYYLYEGMQKRDHAWIVEALDYIEGYFGKNLLQDHYGLCQLQATKAAEEAALSSEGQGFTANADARKEIELYAEDCAIAYFKNSYRFIKRVADTHSIDLHFKDKDGSDVYVEVKGTQSSGKKIFLTRNEVLLNKRQASRYALFIQHSIHVKETINKKGDVKYKASGGESYVEDPWVINTRALKVVTYQYTLSE